MSGVRRRSFLAAVLSAVPFAMRSGRAAGQSPTRGVSPIKNGRDRFGSTRPIPTGASSFKIATADSGGSLFVMEHSNVRQGGPPRHLHHGEDEFFYVIEGDYLVEVGSDRYQLTTGDCILGPRQISHTWAFVGATSGRLLIAYAPAGKMEAFFAERDRRGGGYANDAAVMRAYGMELLGPPIDIS